MFKSLFYQSRAFIDDSSQHFHQSSPGIQHLLGLFRGHYATAGNDGKTVPGIFDDVPDKGKILPEERRSGEETLSDLVDPLPDCLQGIP